MHDITIFHDYDGGSMGQEIHVIQIIFTEKDPNNFHTGKFG
jgi:hypothetical protein